jgi:protein-tyrosine phosphatase
MIDLHCHILPGIDDGPLEMQTSIAMARIAAEDGIETIVATPHIKDILHPTGKLQELARQLNNELEYQNIQVKVLLGGDVFALLSPSSMKDYTINNSRYILIEFPHNYLPGNCKEILFSLALHGFSPIITHPERNSTIIKKPDLLFDMLNGNVFVQITAGSLTGDFGLNEQVCANYLLRKKAVNFIATDAHSTDLRRPVLSKGLEYAARIIGMQKAKKLVWDNPCAVLEDEPILFSC